MKFLIFLLAAVAGMSLHALEPQAGAELRPDGSLKIGDALLDISVADSAWRFQTNREWRERTLQGGQEFRRITGRVTVDGITGTVSCEWRKTAPGRWRFTGNCDFPADISTPALSATLSLPLPVGGLQIDGRSVPVPGSFRGQVLAAESDARSVTVDLAGGVRLVFSGELRVYVQDSRRWGNNLSLRFYFTPARGSFRRARCEFELAVLPPAVHPVSLEQAANRTFADRDGSGWTGQGSGNDFSAMTAGRCEVSGIPFCVAGKGAVVVGRSAPPQVELQLPGKTAGAINLLHASAFTPEAGAVLGYLDVTDADGSRESIPVRAGIDCDNWHLTMSRPNAVIAVSRENGAAEVGLYASSFPLRKRNPVSMVFRSARPDVFWMVAAATQSDRPVRFSAAGERPFTAAPDRRWFPCRFERRIAAGSPLDFSAALDAPAGKYGRVTAAPDGRFHFSDRPGKSIRFFGVNLCNDANFPDHETARELAEYLARAGYNAVRFHHHDDGLTDRGAAGSAVLNRENLDRLDYLFARLKERGIYVTTDLYTSRPFHPGDGLSDAKFHNRPLMKALLAIDPAAMENWKQFARRWMEHVNPYTGIAWGQDPALVTLNLVNEEPLVNVWASTPETAARYREKFAQWKRLRNANEEDFPRFLQELQANVLDEQLRFVREELRIAVPLTSLNCNTTMSLTLLRDRFDVVDNHQYFAHPSFPVSPWSLPHRYDQSSPIRRSAVLPRLLMPTRIFGKPFIVTEFNYCNPNIHRAAGGPLLGAYASLQDWAGLWRFAWSHNAENLRSLRDGAAFDAVNDPMQQLGDRIIHALFLRGDMEPAAEKISMAVPDGEAERSVFQGFPDDFSLLGLYSQIGSHAAGRPLPADVKLYRPGMRPVSGDRRIRLDPAAGTFAVATPLTEAVTLPQGTLAAGKLRICDASTFMTVAAVSLDRKPLPESRSILLIHLTNFTATGTGFGNRERTLLRHWGKMPLLIERGTARVELAGAAPWRVAALAGDGTGVGTVEGEFAGGVFRFNIDNCGFPGGVSAYHLTR